MNFRKFLSAFLLLAVFVSLSEQTLMQYLEFFGNADCTNPTGRLVDTDLNLGSRLGFYNAKSVKRNGLWKIHSQLSNSTTHVDVLYQKDGCVQPPSGHVSYVAVERLGNAAQNISFLVFFMEKSTSGVGINTANGTEVTLPRKYMALSWFFEGEDQWTVYPEVDFAGEPTCLRPNEDVTRDHYGFTYNFSSRLIVRSAKIGCTAVENGGEKLTQFRSLLVVAFITIGCSIFVK